MTRPPLPIDAIESPDELGRRPARARRQADGLRPDRISAVAMAAGDPKAGRRVAKLALAHQVLATRADRLARDVGQRTDRRKIPIGQYRRTPATDYAAKRLRATPAAAVRP